MRRGERRDKQRAGQRGFTYVWLLALVAVVGVGLAAVGPLWAEEAKREQEAELLRVGQLYAEAIARYHRMSPGSVRRYPERLEDLLVDTRFVGTVRHLRSLYADPVTRGQPWALLRAADGGIQGIASQSTEPPLRTTAVELGSVRLTPAQRYSDWQFIASALK
jgi:type II secretory pathway pseudopilin PulG